MPFEPYAFLLVHLVIAAFIFMIGFKKRRYFVLAFLLSFGACFAGCWFYPGWSVYTVDTGYLLAFLCSLVVIYATFRATIRQTLYYGIAGYALQNVSNNVYSIVKNISGMRMTSWLMYLFEMAVTLVFGLLIYYFFARKITADNVIVKNGKLLFVSGSVVFVVYIFSSLLSGARTDLFVDTISRLLAIVCCLLALLLQFGFFEQSKLQREKEVFEHLLNMEREQHEISKENIELINLKCHDLKHQIAGLRNIEKSEQEKYLKKIEKSVMIYDAFVKTGNETLDIVLTEKCLMCEKNEIKLTYMVDTDKLSFMETMDIFTLFGNALDNAIECVLAIDDPEKRIISFRVGGRGKIVCFHMENYCESKLVFRNGLPVTTKENNGMHGFGMKSISMVADKYGGTMSVHADNNLFVLNILFPR